MQRAFKARCIDSNTLFSATELKHNPMPLALVLSLYTSYLLTERVFFLQHNSTAKSRTKAYEALLLFCKFSRQREHLQQRMHLRLSFLKYGNYVTIFCRFDLWMLVYSTQWLKMLLPQDIHSSMFPDCCCQTGRQNSTKPTAALCTLIVIFSYFTVLDCKCYSSGTGSCLLQFSLPLIAARSATEQTKKAPAASAMQL